MVFTLEDLFTELEEFYYYSIHLSKKGEMIEKPYECTVIIYLSDEGVRHTRTFNEISLGDVFQSIEHFVSEMKRRKKYRKRR